MFPVVPDVSATVDPVPFGAPAIRVYTDRDGLPQNSINQVCFDAAGFLWIGTQDGAARYDGLRWTNVPMPNHFASNNVRAVCAAADGSVYFGTLGGGLNRFKKDRFVDSPLAADLPDSYALTVLERTTRSGSTELWVGTRKGLVRWADGTLTTLTTADGLPDNVVVHLFACLGDHGEDELWIATQGGLARLSENRLSVFDETDGLPGNSVLSLMGLQAEDGARVLWVGTGAAGLARLRNGSWDVFTTDDGLPARRINALAPVRGAADGMSAWVATPGGLAKVAGRTVIPCGRAFGLPSRPIIAVLSDASTCNDGLMWIGTDGGGLARYRFGRWTSFSRATGLETSTVGAFCEFQGDDGPPKMWVGCADGLMSFEGDRWKAHPELAPPISTEISAMDVERIPGGPDALWYSMSIGGVGRFDGASVAIIDQVDDFPKFAAHTLCVWNRPGKPSVVWVGTDYGLVRIEGSRIEQFDEEAGLPHHAVVRSIIAGESDGTVSMWVATEGGLARIRRDSMESFGSDSGLGANRPLDVVEVFDSNGTRRIVVGIANGGIAWIEPDASIPRWQHLSTETTPDLPNNDVVGLVADRENRVYALTNKGVARITFRGKHHDGTDRTSIEVFTAEDGLPSSECNMRSGYLDSRGRVWVGTVNGAAVLDPATETFDRTPSPLRLTRTELVRSGAALAAGDTLRHDENDIVFEYRLLFYYREADTRFRTQLIGFDDRPSEWTSEAKRSYTNLPAGNYVFRVWARDYAGNISGPVDHEFRIKVAPWRTWWAYAGYATAAGAATYGGVRWRLHQLRLRNEMLEATIREQTADLAAKVDQLRYSEMTTREKADELALAVDQLRVLEQKAQKARLEAIGAKDRALEASRAKSEFLSNMSHELRTPLNAVIGFAQLLERDPDLNREQREHLTAILSSGEHLLHLINDVLSLSKIEAGKMSLTIAQFDLHRTLEGVEAMLRGRTRAKGLQLTVERDPDVPRFVLGDEGKLRQIMINLLGNAVKFTDAGSITLRAAWQDGIGIFEVEDTGHGIAEEELENLFEAFVQTESGRKSKEGTGLGLTISRNFVQMMGGDMRVRSTLGKGTTFTFDAELAAVTEGGDRIETRRIVALESGQPEFRILVVDDVERNRTVLVKLLEAVGFVVDEAADGREAVAKWSSWRPDLILMDKRMPVMDGLAATREIRRLEAEFEDAALPEFEGAPVPPVGRTVIISLSASAFEHEHAEILGAGSDEIITKPFRHERLFEALARHLGARFESYPDEEELEMSIAPTEAPSPDRLRDLPSDWVASLVEAVVRGDVEQCVTIVERIGGRDEELASHLRALVRSYRFDDIQLLIEESLSA